MLLADGHACLQSRAQGVNIQSAQRSEQFVIFACISYQTFLNCKAPCYHKIFILAVLMKSDLTLSGVLGDGFWNFWWIIFSLVSVLKLCWCSDLGYQSLLFLWIPWNLLALVTIPKTHEGQYKIQCDHICGSQPHQLAHSAFCKKQNFRIISFLSSSSKSLRESNLRASL